MVTGTGSTLGASPPWATSATRGCGVPSTEARSSGCAKTEPIAARTALGENGSAQSGPRTTVPSTSACAERITAPTLAGSPTACR